jgi:hypothetical protein
VRSTTGAVICRNAVRASGTSGVQSRGFGIRSSYRRKGKSFTDKLFGRITGVKGKVTIVTRGK